MSGYRQNGLRVNDGWCIGSGSRHGAEGFKLNGVDHATRLMGALGLANVRSVCGQRGAYPFVDALEVVAPYTIRRHDVDRVAERPQQ